MKKILLIGLLVVGLLLPVATVHAGVMLYERGDLKIALNDLTACMLYDVKEGDILAGMKTSLIEYQKLNFDVGCIGKYDELSNLDVFVGISYDVKGLNYKDVLYSSVGVFASPGWIDNGPARVGIYGGLRLEF